MKNLILTTSILFLTVFSSRGYTQCLPVNNFGEYINILRQPKNSYFKKVKNEIDKKTLSTSDLERDFPEMFKKKRDEIITVVGITFDKNGQLRKAVILKKSLFNNFDVFRIDFDTQIFSIQMLRHKQRSSRTRKRV